MTVNNTGRPMSEVTSERFAQISFTEVGKTCSFPATDHNELRSIREICIRRGMAVRISIKDGWATVTRVK